MLDFATEAEVILCVCVCVSCSALSDSLQSHGLHTHTHTHTHIYIYIYNYGEQHIQVFSVSQQAPDPGELMVQINSIDHLKENSFLFQEADLFVLFRPSTD